MNLVGIAVVILACLQIAFLWLFLWSLVLSLIEIKKLASFVSNVSRVCQTSMIASVVCFVVSSSELIRLLCSHVRLILRWTSESTSNGISISLEQMEV